MNILIRDRGKLQKGVVHRWKSFFAITMRKDLMSGTSYDWRCVGPDRYIIDLTEDVEQRVVIYRAWNVIRSRVIHHTSFLPTVRFNFNMKRRKSTLKSDICVKWKGIFFDRNRRIYSVLDHYIHTRTILFALSFSDMFRDICNNEKRIW